MLAWFDRFVVHPMPAPPAGSGRAREIWLPGDARRFPPFCPGCGRPAEDLQSMVYERNPFSLGGGVIQLHVPFCDACIALTRKRRSAVWLRAGVAVAIAVAAVNIAALLQRFLLDREAWEAGSATRWIGVAGALIGAVLIARLLPLLSFRRWFFGLEVVDLLLDRSAFCVRVSRDDYAAALEEMYADRKAPAGSPALER